MKFSCYFSIMRFSTECRKTTTKVITDQSYHRPKHNEPIRAWSKYIQQPSSAGKRATASQEAKPKQTRNTFNNRFKSALSRIHIPPKTINLSHSHTWEFCKPPKSSLRKKTYRRLCYTVWIIEEEIGKLAFWRNNTKLSLWKVNLYSLHVKAVFNCSFHTLIHKHGAITAVLFLNWEIENTSCVAIELCVEIGCEVWLNARFFVETRNS